jgi:hypothetical protein
MQRVVVPSGLHVDKIPDEAARSTPVRQALESERFGI